MARAKRRSGTPSWGVQTEGVADVQRALRVLAETDAPFVRAALTRSGFMLRAAAARYAKGSIASKIEFTGIKGKGGALRAIVQTNHPGARSHEFGRIWFYEGYTGRAVKKTGRRVRRDAPRGQRPEPFLGIIKGDRAIADVKEPVTELLTQAFVDEFERIGNGG